jgi:hypothetical protein
MRVGDLVKLIIDDCDGTGTNTPILTDAVFLVLKMTKTLYGDDDALVQCISDASRFEADATNFWVIS